MDRFGYGLKFCCIQENFGHTVEAVPSVDDDYSTAVIWFGDDYISMKRKVRQEFKVFIRDIWGEYFRQVELFKVFVRHEI